MSVAQTWDLVISSHYIIIARLPDFTLLEVVHSSDTTPLTAAVIAWKCNFEICDNCKARVTDSVERELTSRQGVLSVILI